MKSDLCRWIRYLSLRDTCLADREIGDGCAQSSEVSGNLERLALSHTLQNSPVVPAFKQSRARIVAWHGMAWLAKSTT